MAGKRIPDNLVRNHSPRPRHVSLAQMGLPMGRRLAVFANND